MLGLRLARAVHPRKFGIDAPRFRVANLSSFEHPSFSLTEDTTIKEYGVRALRYSHKTTGADVLSIIAPEDTNKVFSINFRTPVNDSMGIPHILEHSVLCGSDKYPVKEPFVDLMKGSLNTFLNAFTYPDRTCYPVASMNTKDFYNLMDVYLDAVLHPRALRDRQVMQQEGWHYEMEDPDKPLVLKGVVYNEMKGVYSSPTSGHYKLTQQGLFPDNSYRHDSGGDPLSIPDLTFEKFKAFHDAYYHPSNAKIFFYGDDDPIKRLDHIEGYLKHYERSTTAVESSVVISQPKRDLVREPVIKGKYPISAEGEEKHMLTVNWMLGDGVAPMSHKEQLALAVLNHLLVGTSSSVLHKNLTESKLGETVMGGGLSDELIQATFSIGLKGIVAEAGVGEGSAGSVESKLTEVQELIHATLRQTAQDGFDSRAIQASMNIVEFHLREFNTGSYPKGLAMMLSVLPDWIYEDSHKAAATSNQSSKSLVDALRFEDVLAELKSDIAENHSQIFKELLQKHFVDNFHRTVVHSKPDRELETRVQEAEVAKLAAIRSKMSADEVAAVIAETAALKHAQLAEDSAEAKATLPRLTLEDIDRKQAETPLMVYVPELEVDGQNTNTGKQTVVLSHDIQSNGILYADVGFDYSGVKHEDIELLGLFGRMLLECGTDKMTEAELHQHINTETGGVSASYMSTLKHARNKISAPEDVVLHLVLRGKVTKEKIPVMFDIFRDIMARAKLDNQKRFIEMLKETKAAKEGAVISNGHSYAATRLGAKFSYLGYLAERSSGITYISQLNRLLDEATNDWPSVLTRLEGVRDSIYRRNTDQSKSCGAPSPSLVINLTGSKDVLESSKDAVADFLSKVPVHTPSSSATDPATAIAGTLRTCPQAFGNFSDAVEDIQPNEGFIIPSQVNYVVRGGQLVLPGEELSAIKPGSFSVIAKYLSTSYLWDYVRVMGGAYGSSCSFGVDSGRFLFSSYRDPNVQDTVSVYDNTGNFLQSQLSQQPAAVEVTTDGTSAAVASTDGMDSQASGEVGISDDVLLQFIIGSIGDLDSPQSPDQQGYSSMGEYLKGEPAEDRQRYRDEILSTNREDFALFAVRLADMFAHPTRCKTVVFGSESALQLANEQNRAEIDKAGFTSEQANERALMEKSKLLELQHAIPPLVVVKATESTDALNSVDV